MNTKTKLSPLQFTIFIITTTFGTSMLSLPRELALIAKQDIWLSIILGCLVALFSFWVVIKLAQYYPRQTPMEYNILLLGRIPGMILNVFFLASIVVALALLIRLMMISLKIYLLDLTPPQILGLILFIVPVYAVQYGLAPVVRLQQFNLFSSYSLFLIILVLGFLSIDVRNYLPVLADGVRPVVSATVKTCFPYAGINAVVILLYPSLLDKKLAFKYGAIAILVVALLYLLIVFITIGILGPAEVAGTIVPTVIAYRAVEIPDTFIERLDGYLMITWIAVNFITMVNGLFLLIFGAQRVLRLESSRPLAILFMPLILYIAFTPSDFNSLMAFESFANLTCAAWMLGIWPVLLAWAYLKNKRQNHEKL